MGDFQPLKSVCCEGDFEVGLVYIIDGVKGVKFRCLKCSKPTRIFYDNRTRVRSVRR